jgi:hypothetical protein
MARAKTVKNLHLNELSADSAVRGVGLGAGESPGEAAIVVFVARGQLHSPIPTILDGVEVRVKAIGPIKAYSQWACPEGKPPESDLPSLR